MELKVDTVFAAYGTLHYWTSRDDLQTFLAAQIRAVGCAQAEMTEAQEGTWLATEVAEAPWSVAECGVALRFDNQIFTGFM